MCVSVTLRCWLVWDFFPSDQLFFFFFALRCTLQEKEKTLCCQIFFRFKFETGFYFRKKETDNGCNSHHVQNKKKIKKNGKVVAREVQRTKREHTNVHTRKTDSFDTTHKTTRENEKTPCVLCVCVLVSLKIPRQFTESVTRKFSIE